MKYRLKISDGYIEGDSKEVDKKELQELGFVFAEDGWNSFVIENAKPIWPDDVDSDFAHVEINTLEELHTFIKRWGSVVVDKDTIEIYNGYRE